MDLVMAMYMVVVPGRAWVFPYRHQPIQSRWRQQIQPRHWIRLFLWNPNRQLAGNVHCGFTLYYTDSLLVNICIY